MKVVDIDDEELEKKPKSKIGHGDGQKSKKVDLPDINNKDNNVFDPSTYKTQKRNKDKEAAPTQKPSISQPHFDEQQELENLKKAKKKKKEEEDEEEEDEDDEEDEDEDEVEVEEQPKKKKNKNIQ